MTIDPADLSDPVKAEAFLRETLDGLNYDLYKLKIGTDEEIRILRERHRGDDALPTYIGRACERMRLRSEPLERHRDQLIDILVQVDAIRARMPIVVDERHVIREQKT